MNNLNEFPRVAVLQLLIDLSQIFDVQLTFLRGFKQGEAWFSSFLAERASLNDRRLTILAVSYFWNCSKSRAVPWVEPWISESSLKTNLHLESTTRVLTVRRTSLNRLFYVLDQHIGRKGRRVWWYVLKKRLGFWWRRPWRGRFWVLSFSWIYLFEMKDISKAINYKLRLYSEFGFWSSFDG